MRNADRTTKFLLAVIAIFLGFLVCRSVFMTPKAIAQTTTTPPAAGTSVLQNYSQSMQNTTGNVLAYRTAALSTIGISTKDKVRTINVVDSAQSFIVQFDDRIEVYRIDALDLTDLAAQRAAARNKTTTTN